MDFIVSVRLSCEILLASVNFKLDGPLPEGDITSANSLNNLQRTHVKVEADPLDLTDKMRWSHPREERDARRVRPLSC